MERSPRDTSQLYTTGVLSVTGSGSPDDFNGDGNVDAADFILWRKGLGEAYKQNDYDVWRANFGATAGSGSRSALGVRHAWIPNYGSRPSSLAQVMVCFVATGSIRRSRKTHSKRMNDGQTPPRSLSQFFPSRLACCCRAATAYAGSATWSHRHRRLECGQQLEPGHRAQRPADTATINGSFIHSISLSSSTEVNGIVFSFRQALLPTPSPPLPRARLPSAAWGSRTIPGSRRTS